MHRNAWPTRVHDSARAVEEVRANDDVITRDGVENGKLVSHAAEPLGAEPIADADRATTGELGHR